MIHLIFIPILFVAAIVEMLSVRYELKIVGFIANVAILVAAILFIYFFLDYKGFNLIEYWKVLLRI